MSPRLRKGSVGSPIVLRSRWTRQERVRDPFDSWFAALEARHLRGLSFAEVRRGLQALSSLYVERRHRLSHKEVFGGAGKRAAFALYYGALHYLLVRQIVRATGAAHPTPDWILDLGCGTGSAAAAWALETMGLPQVIGVDRSAFAVDEARWTLRGLRLKGRVRQEDLCGFSLPPGHGAILMAFAVNELTEAERSTLCPRILEAARKGVRVLVLEPLSRRVTPWWAEWANLVRREGGREDEWRFPAILPETLAGLARAAGLAQRELTGRSLYLPGRRP